MLADSPAAPAAPLPKKFFDTFWEPCFKSARVEGSLKIMLEKGKTTLLPFSPYSGELRAGKVKPRHFNNGVP